MLVEMLAAVDACVDPDCRRSLKALADLFALDRIYNDIIFRNDDYIAPEKVGWWAVAAVVALIALPAWLLCLC
jgi:hypothetical protein